jgi:hypothetical protein
MTEGTRSQSTWPVDHVADGIDAGHRGLEVRIDGDAAVRRQFHTHLVQSQPFDERPPANADQYDIGLKGLGRATFCRLHSQGHARVGRLRLGDLRTQFELQSLLGE